MPHCYLLKLKVLIQKLNISIATQTAPQQDTVKTPVGLQPAINGLPGSALKKHLLQYCQNTYSNNNTHNIVKEVTK